MRYNRTGLWIVPFAILLWLPAMLEALAWGLLEALGVLAALLAPLRPAAVWTLALAERGLAALGIAGLVLLLVMPLVGTVVTVVLAGVAVLVVAVVIYAVFCTLVQLVAGLF